MTPPAISGKVRQAAGTLAAAASRARAAGATDAASELTRLSKQADAIAEALASWEIKRIRRGAPEEDREG